jgi:cytochrome P450
MSARHAEGVLRPGPQGFRRWLVERASVAIPFGLRVLRGIGPIVRLPFTSIYVVPRHDGVREVFGAHASFHVPYKANLDVITDGEPFFLGTDDWSEHHKGLEAMRRVVRADDLPKLAMQTETQAEAIVASSGGRLEVVDQLVRRVAFDVLTDYFGVPPPLGGRLDVWATRLFEFQFASSPKDRDLRQQVEEIAPAFRAHIDGEIARRKATKVQCDDVLGRCLDLQMAGEPGFSDVQIRTAILCMVVGGPPQPPMVVPQALEQLLRRPDALAAARAAALGNEDEKLHRIVIEAMRFDPLAPGLPRIAAQNAWVARGTRGGRMIPEGSTVIAAFPSAMMDSRRVPSPKRFDPDRRAHEYIQFGLGLHECFGRDINRATLHRMLKPLLKCPNLRRAPGRNGRLTKNGPFAERLVVEFG